MIVLKTFYEGNILIKLTTKQAGPTAQKISFNTYNWENLSVFYWK